MIEVIALVLTGLGLTASIIYYATIMRNANETQRLQLETRRMQLIMDIDQEMKSYETYNKIIELINMEWENYDDFERKYGSDNNPDNFAKRYSVLYRLNSIGILVRDGFFDAETVYDLLGDLSTIWLWKKFEPIIRETRFRYNVPLALNEFEYLYVEAKKLYPNFSSLNEFLEARQKYQENNLTNR